MLRWGGSAGGSAWGAHGQRHQRCRGCDGAASESTAVHIPLMTEGSWQAAAQGWWEPSSRQGRHIEAGVRQVKDGQQRTSQNTHVTRDNPQPP